MVYNERFIGAVKCRGKFLRDKDGIVKIPFGEEYKLFLKNIEARDAVVKVWIDGKSVLGESSIVIAGNSSTNLEGFLKGNQVKNRFKFIKFDKNIEENLGYDPEDSLIKIQYQFKKQKPIEQEIITTYRYHDNWWYNPWYPSIYWDRVLCGKPDYSGISESQSYNTINCSSLSEDSCFISNLTSSDDLGITVKGSECDQKFQSTYVGELEEQVHTIVLRLSGYAEENRKVEEVIGARDKQVCLTCGRKNDNESKFCSRCGTFLQ